MAAPGNEASEAGSPGGALRVGERFADRYLVRRLLGAGAMGAVYAVHDEAVGEDVALKVLTVALGDGARGREALERFRREVRVARRVTHRNVARTYDLGENAGRHFLTMELVEGEPLDARLAREGRVPLGEAIEIGRQICEGLAAAHAAGVVHRDLKPANVMCEPSGRVVVTDFGIARSVEGEAGTKATGVIGTPAYMAPEQVAGGPVGAPADVFAFGVLLYELLTGTLPFGGETPIAAAMARVLEAPRDPRAHAHGIPAVLAELVMACLARDPNARPSSADAIAAELRACAQSAISQTVVVPIAPPTSSRTAPASTGPRAPPSGALRAGPWYGRTIAVLPLRYRGPSDHQDLGRGIAEQVSDALSTTRGLRVVASSASASAADERDPRKVGAALGVDLVVEGSLQVAGERVRVAARLIDVTSGTQVWAEKFDRSIDDLLALEDTLSQRIAEALRVELTTLDDGGRQPLEVLDSYFRGRRELRRLRVLGPDGALAAFDAALELAPTFKLAIAAHAMAAARSWFAQAADPEACVRAMRLSEASVARALREAPELAETHLASAVFELQKGEFAATSRAASHALAIAPTYADAHEFLGGLLCEAGRADRGLAHLKLAAELDPSMLSCLAGIARHHALRGEWAEYRRTMTAITDRGGDRTIHKLNVELRAALWRRDLDEARRTLAGIASAANRATTVRGAELLGRYAVGEIELPALMEATAGMTIRGVNQRFNANVQQMICEAHAVREDWDLAFDALRSAAEGALVDIEWLDHCALLGPLRERPEAAEIRDVVHARAEVVWL